MQPQENAARDLSEARLNDDQDLRLEIQRLGEDMKARGCLTPLLVRPSGSVFIVLDGNRRLAAAKMVGIGKLPCLAIEGTVTPQTAAEIQLITCLHKADLTAWEKYQTLARLMALNQGLTGQELAARLHVDPATVCRLLSVGRAIPPAQEALRLGQISLSQINVIAQQPVGDQSRFLEMALAKVPVAQMAQLSKETKQQKNDSPENEEKPKVKRIKLLLSSGTTVTLSGAELMLESAIKAADEAHKLMEKGRKDGLTAKTIQQISSERANGKPQISQSSK